MTTLHIEHAIKDIEMWREAFRRAAPLRAQHGVRGYDIRQPVDDEHYVTVDLTFDNAGAAEGFLVELHKIWQTPTASPALAGTPRTRILEMVESTQPCPIPLATASGTGHETSTSSTSPWPKAPSAATRS
jgi:hypothetical protein